MSKIKKKYIYISEMIFKLGTDTCQ